jgi:gluconate 2-dehydrogenase alpha chain
MHHRTDVLVVGLGAAGGIIAGELAKAGAKVLALDKGAHYQDEDFYLKHDEIKYFSRGAIVPRMETDPVTWRPDHRTKAVVLPWASGLLGVGDPFQIPPSIGSGGGTLHWGGLSWRHREADFRMRSAVVERFGEGVLPEDTTLVDWPLSYQDLEPYYDRVEWEVGVSGQAGNIDGQQVPGGNPFEAPRQRGYPMPPLQRGPAEQLFAEACTRLGYHPFPLAAAIASVPFRGRNACVYCGFCHGFPCHVGAKSSSRVTSIEEGLATGNLTVVPFARVYQVNRDTSQRRVRGVSYFGSDLRAYEIEADVVILATYSLENARLLLASGINGNGQVGQHLMIHNYGWFTCVLPEWTNPFMGTLVAGSAIDDLTSERIPDNDEGVFWGSPIISWPGDTQPIEAAHSLPPRVPRWGCEFKSWLEQNYRRLYKMYSVTSTLPSRQHYCDLDPTITDQFGQPALRITHDWTELDRKSVEYFMKVKRRIGEEMGMVDSWEDPPDPSYHVSVHDVGTHRMGEDPNNSVVNRYGEVHECAGLYAVGGGQFPSLPSYNPTQTIQALAFLTAEHLMKKGQ